MGKSRPSSLSHSVAFGPKPSPQGAPPRQPEERALFPGSCPFLGPQRAVLKFLLPPQREDGRKARWPFTRLQLECGELLLLQITSGLRMKNTLTVRGVLESGDSRRSDRPTLTVVSYGTFCLGVFPQTTAGGGRLLHRPIRASTTTAQSPATGSTEARHPALQVWASPGTANHRTCLFSGRRSWRGRPRLCHEVASSEGASDTVLLRELG